MTISLAVLFGYTSHDTVGLTVVTCAGASGDEGACAVGGAPAGRAAVALPGLAQVLLLAYAVETRRYVVQVAGVRIRVGRGAGARGRRAGQRVDRGDDRCGRAGPAQAAVDEDRRGDATRQGP